MVRAYDLAMRVFEAAKDARAKVVAAGRRADDLMSVQILALVVNTAVLVLVLALLLKRELK